jgi:hypothetical protein
MSIIGIRKLIKWQETNNTSHENDSTNQTKAKILEGQSKSPDTNITQSWLD